MSELSFSGERPTAASLSIEWKRIIASARATVPALPAAHVGECVLDRNGNLLRLDAQALAEAIESGTVRFHTGSLHGAFPAVVPD